MRANLLSYLTGLESQARSLALDKFPSSDIYLEPFYTQIDGLKDELRRIAVALPTATANLQFSASQTLAADWQRASLAISQAMGALSEKKASFRARVASSSGQQVPSSVMTELQRKMEAVQELFATLTMRHPASQRLGFADPSAFLASAQASWPATAAGGVFSSVREMEAAMYARACELAKNGSHLITYTDLPTLWRNNEHILSGYRFIPLENWWTLTKSAFQWHNETINIHSHVAGIAVVLPLFWPSKGLDPQTTWADRLVQTIYLVAAIKCLVSSVIWHVFSGCSNAKWFERAACVDYSGVALLVAASVWTTIYNEFYCQPNLAMLYSLSTLAVGVVGAVVPWQAWFNERRNKSWRIAVFLGMCFTGLAPFAHAAFEHGLGKTLAFLRPILPSLACYIIGLVFYATHWPERAWPGRFDRLGHAHQLWHIAIVLAILLHYRAALQFHANRFDFSCSSSTEAAQTFADSSTSLLKAAGGLQGIEGLQRADNTVYGWRLVAGRLGGGAVGRLWTQGRAWLQTW